LPGERCLRAYILNRSSGHVEPAAARFTVLASWWREQVYLYQATPTAPSGDGNLPWPGGRLPGGNMEFNQFHPPASTTPRPKAFW